MKPAPRLYLARPIFRASQGIPFTLRLNPDLRTRGGLSASLLARADEWKKGLAMVSYLIHNEKDDVGVAVVDIKAGDDVRGLTLDTRKESGVRALMDVPLGHKIALRDFGVGDTVTKYGQDIGKVVEAIKKGEHVHVHNVKTKRW